jgi:hypothetical protein
VQVARIGLAGWAVVTIVIGAAISGCGGSNKTSSPSSSSAAASTSSTVVTGPPPGQPTDYGSFLINSSDVGGGLAAPQSPMLSPNNAPGAVQLFANADSSRRLWDTIVVTADTTAAAAELATNKTSYAGKVSGTWQPVAVGINGTMISGSTPDNSQAMTVLLFTEGKAAVTLEFDSGPGDPFDPAVVTDIGRKQDAAIKKRLPG